MTIENNYEYSSDEHSGVKNLALCEPLSLKAKVEALIFAAPKPISAEEISELLKEDDFIPDLYLVERIIHNLASGYTERKGGFRLEYDEGAGYQFRTVPGAASIMEKMFSSSQRTISRAALETLSIIAYNQPCTRADIEHIRGVDVGSIIANLLEKELLCCVGRKPVPGRPMLFGTTEEFLRVFGIKGLAKLPPLSDFSPQTDKQDESTRLKGISV